MEGKITSFEKKVTESVQQLYANDRELKSGVSSAEFNLRSHQKVLNAICLELERFRMLFQAILPPEQREVLDESIVQISEVTLPPEEEGGEPKVVRRPNWPYYHDQVEKDLKILAELEAQQRAEAKAEQDRLEQEKAAEKAKQEELALKAEAVMDDEAVEAELPADIAELGEGGKEEDQDDLPHDTNDDLPEGAAVFGG